MNAAAQRISDVWDQRPGGAQLKDEYITESLIVSAQKAAAALETVNRQMAICGIVQELDKCHDHMQKLEDQLERLEAR